MSNSQLDEIISLLQRVVDQTEPKTVPVNTVNVYTPTDLDEDLIARVTQKQASSIGLWSAKDELQEKPVPDELKIRQTHGKKIPVRGADYIAAKDVVPDLDAISINGGKTYDMVVDAQYNLDTQMVELTTDNGYSITSNFHFRHRFRANPESYGE